MQFGRLEVHLIPGQAQDFALARAENEDQHEGGVQGFGLVSGQFKEPAGIINSPGLPFTARLGGPAPSRLHRLDRVMADHLLIDRVRVRSAECAARIFAASRGQRFLAAFSDGAGKPRGTG